MKVKKTFSYAYRKTDSLILFLIFSLCTITCNGNELLPEFQFSSASQAETTFTPMDGSLPVSLKKTDSRTAILLPINFANTTHSRASWDIKINHSMISTAGIQFDFHCSNMTPISHFSIYFRSGKGWYVASFSPDEDNQWKHIIIDKSITKTEGTPNGWGKVDLIRISAWRATSDKDTECAIANVESINGDAEILIIRADSSIAPDNSESDGYIRYARNIASTIQDLGIKCLTVSDSDVTDNLLAGKKLVILPYNPKLPNQLLPALQKFTANNGQIIVLYSVAEGIDKLLGIKRGTWTKGPFSGFSRTNRPLYGQPLFAGQDSPHTQVMNPIDGISKTVAVWRHANGNNSDIPAIVVSDKGTFIGHVWIKDTHQGKKELMMSLIGNAILDTWEKASQQAYIGIDTSSSLIGNDIHKKIESHSKQSIATLKKSDKLKAQAKKHIQNKEWQESITISTKAANLFLQAWCMTQKSTPNEFRGVWCHDALGITGQTWDESIKQLAKCGFTAILPNMMWGGTAYYKSEFLPVNEKVKEQGDQIAECLAACNKYGIECHVWKVNWNMGSGTSKETVAYMRKAGRVQVDKHGAIKERWLCPSDPRNRDLEINSMLEVAQKYNVHGLHFDYIRYPDNTLCFCNGCRKRFEKRIGKKVSHWPDNCFQDKEIKRAWLDFRRSNIDIVVKTVSERARKIRPDIKISAAVFRNWPVDRNTIGQDSQLWCQRGWVDFLCPMDYTENSALFSNLINRQLKLSDKTKIYPGIGISCWDNPSDIVKMIEHIKITRKAGTGGFTIFNYDTNTAKLLELLSLGTTKTE